MLKLTALRSVNVTINEIILILYFLHQEEPIKMDSAAIGTGLSRSSVASILSQWKELGEAIYKRRQGYSLTTQAEEHLQWFVDEIHAIGEDRLDYFNADLLKFILRNPERNRRRLDVNLSITLRNRNLSSD